MRAELDSIGGATSREENNMATRAEQRHKTGRGRIRSRWGAVKNDNGDVYPGSRGVCRVSAEHWLTWAFENAIATAQTSHDTPTGKGKAAEAVCGIPR